MKRRILYITNRFRSYDVRMLDTLADAFDMNVIWISPPPPGEEIPPELASRIRWWVVGDATKILKAKDVRRNAELFRRIVQAGRGCDLIVASTSDSWKARVAYVAARAIGVPIAFRKERWRDDDVGLHGIRKLYWDLQDRVTELVENRATGVMVGGAAAGNYLVDRGLPADRVLPFRYLHPDLADRPLDPEAVARLQALKGNRIAFLYLGRVMHQKGLLPFVTVFKRLLDEGRDAALFVAGGPIEKNDGRGPVSKQYFAECQRIAAGDPRIVFLGPVPPDQVHNTYAAADVFVHPHVAQVDGRDVHEGWGNVITEAASMGMPIVTTDRVAAAFDIVEPGVNGYRIRAERVEEDLAGALVPFLDNPELVRTFGRASRQTFERFADPQLNVASLNRLVELAAGGAA